MKVCHQYIVLRPPRDGRLLRRGCFLLPLLLQIGCKSEEQSTEVKLQRTQHTCELTVITERSVPEHPDRIQKSGLVEGLQMYRTRFKGFDRTLQGKTTATYGKLTIGSHKIVAELRLGIALRLTWYEGEKSLASAKMDAHGDGNETPHDMSLEISPTQEGLSTMDNRAWVSCYCTARKFTKAL